MRSTFKSRLPQCEKVIDQSGIAEELELKIAAMYRVPGRPREISVRTLLVGLLSLAGSGSMHLVRLPDELNGLPAQTKRRLGITRDKGITRRQVQRLYQNITNAIGGESGLDELCDRLLQATVPHEVFKTSSIAVDSTTVDSWARRRRDRNGKVLNKDPDARWRGKKQSTPWKFPVFGYDLTVATTVADIGGEDVPLIATRMRFRPAVTDTTGAGLEVTTLTAAMFGKLGDVVIDRGYTNSKDGHEFIMPVRALGGEPIFDLYQHQSGVSDVVHGALIIDGHPHSPATPKNLHHIPAPSKSAPVRDHIEFQEKIAIRSRYAMDPNGSRKANGAWDFACPAHKGKLSCHLVASSKALPALVVPALAAPKTALDGSICTKKFTRFHADEIPLSQRDLYGSRAWFDSFNRRSRVEGYFGLLENEACENVNRGTIRVMGLVKTGLMIALQVASTNMRFTASFRKKQSQPKPRKMGRPRKNPLKVFVPSEVAVELVGANAPPV